MCAWVSRMRCWGGSRTAPTGSAHTGGGEKIAKAYTCDMLWIVGMFEIRKQKRSVMTNYATSPAEYGAVVSAAVEGVIKAIDNWNQFFDGFVDEDGKNRIRDIARTAVDGHLGDSTNMANLSVLVGAAVKKAVETTFSMVWPDANSAGDYFRQYQPVIYDYSFSAEYNGVVNAAVEGVIQVTYDPKHFEFDFRDDTYDFVREMGRQGYMGSMGSNMTKLEVGVGAAVEGAFSAVIKVMKLEIDSETEKREREKRKKPQ